MRVPVSWLTEHLSLGEHDDTAEFPDAFVRIGHEVEDVSTLGPVTGPLVVGRVAGVEELTGFKKPIRYCRVEIGRLTESEMDAADAGEGDAEGVELDLELGGDIKTTGIVCGATNFSEGDLVVVALPGAVLPGGFEIAERKTYGRMSQGMICSARELGIGTDHSGILVLPPGLAEPGTDAHDLLGLDDTVLDLEITPNRGYALSVRGLARELSCALELPYGDPAAVDVPAADGEAWPVQLDENSGCSRFVLRRVSGVDPTAPTPWHIRRRLMLAGIRSISLAVDVTNYVMLEVGQPLHAFDATALQGGLTVRRARTGEKLSTLDDVQRELDPDDVIICDDTGPISLAGVMGGASTEIGPNSTDIVLEAAIWDPRSVARTARRHKLPSEAAKRFERFVDPQLPPAALERAARLLHHYGEGTIGRGRTDVGTPEPQRPVSMSMKYPDKVAGIWYMRGVTVARLTQIGCRVEDIFTGPDGEPAVTVTPPSWRNDLEQPIDLVEEVLRLEGIDKITSELPAAAAGRGLTATQRRRRTVSRSLADSGFHEVLLSPFTAGSVADAFGLAAAAPRRRADSVLNPLDAEAAQLATTLLPGLLEALARNVSRGNRDVALFHIGQVTQPAADLPPVPDLPVGERPTDAQLIKAFAALPAQPVHAGAVLTGLREPAGWWGPGRDAGWADAIAAALTVGRACGVELRPTAVQYAPWHPGRCAALLLDGVTVGHAGELHPKVLEALELPKRACAMELSLDAIPVTERKPAPMVSPHPPVLLDVALVVDAAVPAAEVSDALRAGAGELLEDVALFDVYTGPQVGDGKRSLAYALRFRAPDRTLTLEEANAAKENAVASAGTRLGAVLR